MYSRLLTSFNVNSLTVGICERIECSFTVSVVSILDLFIRIYVFICMFVMIHVISVLILLLSIGNTLKICTFIMSLATKIGLRYF